MDIPTSDTLVVPPAVNSRDWMNSLLREENNVASIRPFQLNSHNGSERWALGLIGLIRIAHQ